MKGLLMAVLMAPLVFAVIPVGCGGTYNMGSTFFENFHSCALNSFNPPAGGSAVIANNNFYCVKITQFYGNFAWWYAAVTNVQLLKGVNCDPWLPTDYCYAHMNTGNDCNKNVGAGMSVTLGQYSPDGSITYICSSYDNAICSTSVPNNPAMILLSNSILVNSVGVCRK